MRPGAFHHIPGRGRTGQYDSRIRRIRASAGAGTIGKRLPQR